MDPDPTPFFGDLKAAKNYYFFIFFSYNYPQAHYLQSKKFYFLLHYNEKLEGSGSVPLTNGSGSGRPKNTKNMRIRIPNTGSRTLSYLSGFLQLKQKVWVSDPGFKME
jgi:hypothetical protein